MAWGLFVRPFILGTLSGFEASLVTSKMIVLDLNKRFKTMS